ncbi:MAG: sigma-70 family RNA polymerase sigma factor [Chthonomonadales bacterium]|nr:sigma-70 family RNA polymerase sigma factor [Chthonomonadales bacterium]
MINLLRLRAWLPLPDEPRVGALARDPDALFESLVDSHYRRIYSLAYRMVGSEADAADITQETFVRAYRALPRLRAEGAHSAWLRRIATNLCLDALRRRRTALPTTSLDAPLAGTDAGSGWDLPDDGADPFRACAAGERASVLRRAIDCLPQDYRTVIVLHHLEDVPVEEIAAALGEPTGTVKSRLSRARKALRRRLSPYFDPDLADRR